MDFQTLLDDNIESNRKNNSVYSNNNYNIFIYIL